ncbi:MAG: hypothetical protein JW999_04420 [Methanotrichaceae archaeon]|nr:hypothetical protein [Methanotrichaceae archaeon]
MTDQLTQLNIKIEPAPDAEIDDKEMERLTRQLQKELEELNVDSVALAPEGQKPPEGSKAIQLATLGQLLVMFSQAGGVLPALINLLQFRFVGKDCSIKLKIGDDELELKDASDETQERLLDAWLDRHHTG